MCEVVCEVLAVSDVIDRERVQVGKRRYVVVSTTVNRKPHKALTTRYDTIIWNLLPRLHPARIQAVSICIMLISLVAVYIVSCIGDKIVVTTTSTCIREKNTA